MHLSTHPTSYPTRYQEIAARLEQELRQHYRCGDYLPAEHQLAARFEVNRHTLRRAIDQLVERGWVQRRQGVGVLVLMRPFDYPLNTGRALVRICWTGQPSHQRKTAGGAASGFQPHCRCAQHKRGR